MIILLDLNYTLVANSPKHGTTPPKMEKRLQEERYRQWLVELVRPEIDTIASECIVSWMIPTLERIEQETGWKPDDACFAPKGWWNPPRSRSGCWSATFFLSTAATPATSPSRATREAGRCMRSSRFPAFG